MLHSKNNYERRKINDGTGTTQDSNGAVEQAINSTPGSVSYLAMSYMVGDKRCTANSEN